VNDSLSVADTSSVGYSATLVFFKYVPLSRYAPRGHIRYGFTPVGLGYIAIADFSGMDWVGDMDLACVGRERVPASCSCGVGGRPSRFSAAG
jgi:hypothetical protein